MKYSHLNKRTTVNEHHSDTTKIPHKSGGFINERGEDDINITEAASVQKSADLLGVFEQETPFSEHRSIRKHCLWCVCDSSMEVRLCPSTNCPLHPLRFGKRSPLAPHPLKSIRAKCKDCAPSLKDIRSCEMKDCALYPYRMGRRPKRA